MLAVVKISGQQFIVEEGKSLFVPHLQGEKDEIVHLSDVLLTNDNGKVQIGKEVTATVSAKIISPLVQGDKVIAFKMKKRKGFRKKLGHRTEYTKIVIEKIA